MQFNFFKLYLVVALCLLNWSCAIFHPDKVERDDDGYYYRHYSSCGPTALNKAFKELNINLGRNNISRDIQDSGNVFRFLLSLVHYDTVQITFPSEIYQVIENNGFKVIELKTLEQTKILYVSIKDIAKSLDSKLYENTERKKCKLIRLLL